MHSLKYLLLPSLMLEAMGLMTIPTFLNRLLLLTRLERLISKLAKLC
ncbi:hypothetical protein AM1_4018 [Acaryochloris marina MBIC11017]|uniref:Uncharacterized protein n=1 Tax=Acaryochloris marina (strain MBIC 11017) TaxID=329726 RepID=B0C9I8_ACAM1|nr:hypothetical protein AM1_4018 [Acaryochloris marina MBIC11017]